jgi:hypothetical protein
MGIGFLSPLFALGLAALALPILVHLVHRERKESTAFPSLLFLQRTPYQHSRRQRIRHWVLFLLRSGALLLLVAAFARPVLRQALPIAAGSGAREVVILLDRSFSMSLGARWERARAAVAAVIDRLESSDRATLVLFDEIAQATTEPTSERPVLRAALDSARPLPAGTRYAPAVALAHSLLARSTLPKREVVVVSDMQRSGWDLTEEGRFPPGTVVTSLDVGGDSLQDRAVRGVEVGRDPGAGQERAVVRARVANVGPAAAAVEVRLEVAGRVVGRERVNLPASAGAAVTFRDIVVSEWAQPAVVRLASDGYVGDDVFHFVLERQPRIRTLLVEAGAPGGTGSLFLRRALEVVDDPGFDIKSVRLTQLGPADFEGRQLIVWNDAPYPPPEPARRLADAVRAGAGLLVVLGEEMAPRTWPSGAGSLLGGGVGEVVDRLAEKGTSIGVFEQNHPALAFFAMLGGAELTAPKVYRYRALAANSGILARYQDGGVALAEHPFGRGRVMIWTSAFDGYWNDLPRHPVFLPLAHQLGLYAAAYRGRRPFYEVGEAVELSTLLGSVVDSGAPAGIAVRTPSGQRLRIGGGAAGAALRLREQGIYEIRPGGSPAARPALLAANIPARELEFTRFDPLRLTHALLPLPGEEAVAQASGRAVELVAQERRQSLWWYLLIIVVALLLGESLLAGRLPAVRRSSA